MKALDDVSRVLDLVRRVTIEGPQGIAYDGLRMFQHPDRVQRVLTGEAWAVSPVTIDLWPSLSCNARCPLCPYRMSGARDVVDRSEDLELLSLAQAREILIGAAVTGVRSVIFTGGGEPLLHPNVPRLAALAREAGLQWALFTNGIRLNSSLAAELLALRPAFLRISLDAGTADAHSRIYATPPSAFSEVVANAVAGARIAAEIGTRAFGLSFTLGATTDEKDLIEIREIIRYISDESGGGLGLVAFRPRTVHYRRGLPCCPQPHGNRFIALASAVRSIVIDPLELACRHPPRMDIKAGLFRLAASDSLTPACYSSPWMTTIDHTGVGYVTAELAGAPGMELDWGRMDERRDFGKFWGEERRRSIVHQLETGGLKLPLVHRTSPVDAFLTQLRDAVEMPLEGKQAARIINAVISAQWYRSVNGDFV